MESSSRSSKLFNHADASSPTLWQAVSAWCGLLNLGFCKVWSEVCGYVTNTWTRLTNGMPLNPLVNLRFANQNGHFGVSSVFGQAHIQILLSQGEPKRLQQPAAKKPMPFTPYPCHVHPI